MGYKNQIFSHDQRKKIGVLITNLGTPTAPTKRALRTYLKQFLSDPRVVEVPRLLWWLVLNGIILNIRPSRSAKAYTSVWTEQGSPLAIHTSAQAQQLSTELQAVDDRIVVEWAMRYGSPSIADALQNMMDKGVRKLVVLPLYPQYSGATTASTFDALAADFTHRRWLPELRFLTSYYDHPAYINAIVSSIRHHWSTQGRAEMLLLSYHGVPLRYLQQGDPYHCQCLKTSGLVASALGLDASEYITSFQSRFGREQWLQPYTDEILKSLPAKGVKSVQIICPGFSADCLETIEEIGEENRAYFMASGGSRYDYIPALNSEPEHIELLKQLVMDNIQTWLIPEGEKLEALQNRQNCANSHPFNQK
ncbi:ferrochelatase [Teredinibacter haidensis]|uniref:ferrochelatase n=1 Tax=Teredinibacter haidensis TaxID=2731755 RepID=UPI000948FB9E|nr:ferrochelatase [Teredinibacter haidensis]